MQRGSISHGPNWNESPGIPAESAWRSLQTLWAYHLQSNPATKFPLAMSTMQQHLVQFSYLSMTVWIPTTDCAALLDFHIYMLHVTLASHRRWAKLSGLSGWICWAAASSNGISNATRLSQAIWRAKPVAAKAKPWSLSFAVRCGVRFQLVFGDFMGSNTVTFRQPAS